MPYSKKAENKLTEKDERGLNLAFSINSKIEEIDQQFNVLFSMINLFFISQKIDVIPKTASRPFQENLMIL